MKKVLLLILLLASPLLASQDLREDHATEIVIKFVDASDGVTAETSLTVTDFDCTIYKHADASISATALTVTASGGSNDSSHLADGNYRLELTATDTSTAGRLRVHCQCSGAAPFEQTFNVLPQVTYDQKYTADFLSAADITAAIWEADPSSYTSTQAGYFLYRAKRSIVEGTADSGTTTTIVDAARTEGDTDYWAGNWIKFTSGSVSGQVRYITGFTPASDTITFAPAVTQDTDTETYEILQGVDYLRPATSGRTLLVSAAGAADANVTQNAGSNITASSGRQEVNVSHFGGSAGTFSSGRPEVNTTHAAGTAWNSGAITVNTIASDAFTAAKFASDVSTEFATTIFATTYEGSHTFKHFLQYGSSALFGKYSASGSTFNFRDLGDSKNRIVYTTTSTSRATVTLSPD